MLEKLANMKFKYKIVLSLTTVTVLAITFLTYIFSNNIIQITRNYAFEKAETSTISAAKEMENRLDTLIASNTKFLMSQTIEGLLVDIYFARADLAKNFANTSDSFNIFENSNSWLSMVYIYSKQQQLFSGSAHISTSLTPDIESYDLWSVKEITYLPYVSNEFSHSEYVIPLVLPLNYYNNTYWQYGESAVQPIRCVNLISVEDVNDLLESYTNNYTHGMYLTDENANLLNSPSISIFEDENLKHILQTKDTTLNLPITIDGDLFYLTHSTIQQGKVKVVHLIYDETIRSALSGVSSSYLGMFITAILLSFILSFTIGDFLLRPMHKLTNAVVKIKNGSYNSKEVFKYSDEIGTLGNQINSMHEQIILQIEKIKEDEREKSNAEIALLTEQVNPHFLYNTLGCIHLQILSKENDSAANMIQSLSSYLRLTLNTGNTLTELSQELMHVGEYINLMNRDFSNIISCNFYLQEDLQHYEIIKTLLQPMAENSIKHGFAAPDFRQTGIKANISISITSKNDKIIIEFSDNGLGIDIKKAETLIKSTDKSTHFGLRNIYRRISSFYGEENVEMTFDSIPYYKNTITLMLPYNR